MGPCPSFFFQLRLPKLVEADLNVTGYSTTSVLKKHIKADQLEVVEKITGNMTTLIDGSMKKKAYLYKRIDAEL